MNSDNVKMPEGLDGAIDLGAVKEAADRANAEAEMKRMQEIQRRAESWDRAMTRAFKGIVPAPERRRQLRRAVEADDAE